MSLSGFELEQAVLETMVPDLEADGFRVVIHPRKDVLPTFLSEYHPDMVAYKGDHKVAIEIMSTQPESQAKERRLRDIFKGHPEWELRFIYAPPASSETSIPVAPDHVISEHLERIEASFDTMGLSAALLTGWAVFEAAARAQLPSNLIRPQSPARLIEALASEGCITPDEADELRRLGRIRNEVAHGRLDLTPSQEDVTRLINTTRAILSGG